LSKKSRNQLQQQNQSALHAKSVANGQTVSIAQMHVGPLPPARDLVMLEESVPSSMIRVIEMAECEQKRQTKRDEVITGNQRKRQCFESTLCGTVSNFWFYHCDFVSDFSFRASFLLTGLRQA